MTAEEQKRVDLYRRNPAVALAAYGRSYFESRGLDIRPPRKRSPRADSNYFRTYYQKNREKLLADALAYHAKNRDARLAYGRAYHAKNRRNILDRRRVESLSPEVLDAKRAKERARYAALSPEAREARLRSMRERRRRTREELPARPDPVLS
jgi:hypothetical protein